MRKKETEAIVKVEKPTHATVNLTAEELYMLIGSVASFRNTLAQMGTRAHESKAGDYNALLQRLDREHAALLFRQGEASRTSVTH